MISFIERKNTIQSYLALCEKIIAPSFLDNQLIKFDS